MRKLRKMFMMLSLCLALCTIVAPTMSLTVYAAEEGDVGGGDSAFGMANDTGDTGSAIQDIMEGDRFRGAMSSISKITDFVDIWFVRIISIVSFFIISAAMLKNVCAGAYCANSKFWDKVDEAHQVTDALNLQSLQGFGQKITTVTPGGIGKFFLGIVPNIKRLTDFDDGDIDPKAYWMRAIPQMIGCVIIGIFIYNGYYRDTAAKVGEMGSVLISRTLNSVNPDSFINKLFNTTGWPKSPWEKDSSREGKMCQSAFDELKSIVATNCTDVESSAAKAEVVGNIVTQVKSLFNSTTDTGINMSSYFDVQDGYMWTMSGMSGYMGTRMAGDKVSAEEDDGGNIIVRAEISMGSLVSATTAIDTNTTSAYLNFTLKRVVADGGSGASNVDVADWEKQEGSSYLKLANNTVDLPASYVGKAPSGDGNEAKVTLNDDFVLDLAAFIGTTPATSTKMKGGAAKAQYSSTAGGNVWLVPKGDYTAVKVNGRFCINLGRITNGVGVESEPCYLALP